MNFGEIKTYVQTYAQTLFGFNKMSEGKQFSLGTKLLESFINEGYRLFCSYARTLKEKKFVSTTINVTKYSLSGFAAVGTSNASNNLVQAINVYYASGTDEWKLDPIEDKEQLLVELNTSDSPFKYGLQYGNKQIEVYPKVSATGEYIWIYGVWLPTDMSLDADEPQMPTNYHQALCDYALFKINMLIGALDQTKQSAYTQFDLFKQSFINLAEGCRKEIEYIENIHFQMREDWESDDLTNREYLPIFNHNPLISYLQFKDTLQFYDVSDSIVRLQIDETGIYVNGTALAFLGAHGRANFAGYTSYTDVTIADQGTSDYTVQLTALSTTTPTGNIGEISYKVIGSTSFRVWNTGDNTGEFAYLVIKS